MTQFHNPSAPVFDPSFYYDLEDYNDPFSPTGIGWNTNCFEYAVGGNRFHDLAVADPGNAAGILGFALDNRGSAFKNKYGADVAISSDNLIRGAEADGLQYVGDNIDNENIPDGFYLVTAYIKQGKDYHWLRQNSDGTWSGKDGQQAPYLVTQDNSNITYNTCEPVTEAPEMFGEYKRVGYFLVPAGGIDVGYDVTLDRTFEATGINSEVFQQALEALHNHTLSTGETVLESMRDPSNFDNPEVAQAIAQFLQERGSREL